MMRRINHSSKAMIILGLVISACHNGNGGGNSVPLNEMELQYTTLMCQKMIECEYIYSVAQFNGSVQVCLDWYGRIMSTRFQKQSEAVNAGRVAYDGAAAHQCFEEARSAGCEEYWMGQASAEACNRIFTGQLANGAACTMNVECAGGWCDTRGACPGVCAQSVPLGGSCANEQACQQGAVCGVSNTCETIPDPLAAGQTCTGVTSECGWDLYCDGSTGTCRARLTVGQACEDHTMCGYGLTCVGTCQEVQVMTSEGDPCDDPSAGQHLCSLADGLGCSFDLTTYTGTCTAWRQEGEVCQEADLETGYPTTIYPCDIFADLYCDIDVEAGSGICARLKGIGENCEQDTECVSEYCGGSGTCEEDPAAQCMD